jgi:hypothetical protein
LVVEESCVLGTTWALLRMVGLLVEDKEDVGEVGADSADVEVTDF